MAIWCNSMIGGFWLASPLVFMVLSTLLIYPVAGSCSAKAACASNSLTRESVTSSSSWLELPDPINRTTLSSRSSMNCLGFLNTQPGFATNSLR